MDNRELFARMTDPIALAKLIADGKRVKDDSDSMLPILHVAAQMAPLESIRLLLEAGASHFIDRPDERGFPPVVYASNRGEIEIIQAFVDFGADINAQGLHDEETALTAVVERAAPDFIRGLVRLGADPTLRGSDGASAIGLAEVRFRKNPNEDNRVLLAFLKASKPRRRV